MPGRSMRRILTHFLDESQPLANRTTVDVLINNGLKARTEEGRMRSYDKLAELHPQRGALDLPL